MPVGVIPAGGESVLIVATCLATQAIVVRLLFLVLLCRRAITGESLVHSGVFLSGTSVWRLALCSRRVHAAGLTGSLMGISMNEEAGFAPAERMPILSVLDVVSEALM